MADVRIYARRRILKEAAFCRSGTLGLRNRGWERCFLYQAPIPTSPTQTQTVYPKRPRALGMWRPAARMTGVERTSIGVGGMTVRLAGIATMSYELNGFRSPALTLIGDEGRNTSGGLGISRSWIRVMPTSDGTFYDQKLRIECWAIEQDEVLEGTFTQDDG
ncbi:hypothetical protein BDN72DRAFT_859351 [Pluteus cervinus]|uniref:Uncharacterized protein n=1 Tax=Pluteus cervinus TaxID=181527 RepID=A0ACD3APB7_9AGAR|nr:hypothetical protein BDN72DRAFT_859351 [Pluteus cervinus]